MLEFFARVQHWMFVPDYLKVAKRDLQLAQLRMRQELANAHYSTLMAQYYSSCIERDELLLKSITVE